MTIVYGSNNQGNYMTIVTYLLEKEINQYIFSQWQCVENSGPRASSLSAVKNAYGLGLGGFGRGQLLGWANQFMGHTTQINAHFYFRSLESWHKMPTYSKRNKAPFLQCVLKNKKLIWGKIPFPDDQLAVNYVCQIIGTRAHEASPENKLVPIEKNEGFNS